MHTAFYEKLEGGPGGALELVDAQTRHLFAQYQGHYEQVLREAQEPEEVVEVGANRASRGAVSGRARGDAPPGLPSGRPPPFLLQVFLTAMRAPQPALRYFSTDLFLPLARMRTEDASGSSYVAFMRQKAFADMASSALISVPECVSELSCPASDKSGEDKSSYQEKN